MAEYAPTSALVSRAIAPAQAMPESIVTSTSTNAPRERTPAIRSRPAPIPLVVTPVRAPAASRTPTETAPSAMISTSAPAARTTATLSYPAPTPPVLSRVAAAPAVT